MELSFGKMEINTMVNGKMAKVMGMELKHGVMEENILEHLKTINCMVKELCFTMTVKNIQVNF